MDSTQIGFENFSLALLTLYIYTHKLHEGSHQKNKLPEGFELVKRFSSRLIQLCATYIHDVMRCNIHEIYFVGDEIDAISEVHLGDRERWFKE